MLSKRFSGYGAVSVLRNLAVVFCLIAGPALAETKTIAALGDSLTQGYGLPPEDGFKQQLERWLTDQGANVKILNAGVSGDTTAGGLARVDWTLTPDVDGLIIALGGNDLLRGLDPTVSRAKLEGIADLATSKGVPFLIAGLPAPGNYGPDFKATFDGIFPDVAAAHDAVLVENFLGPIDEQPDRSAALATYMQADGIHPNADGVALIVQAFGPRVLELLERLN